MSKRINVNPDYYKLAGRERPGHAVAQEPRGPGGASDKARERWEKRRKTAIRAKGR